MARVCNTKGSPDPNKILEIHHRMSEPRNFPGRHCYHCGAPLEQGTKCEYCGGLTAYPPIKTKWGY